MGNRQNRNQQSSESGEASEPLLRSADDASNDAGGPTYASIPRENQPRRSIPPFWVPPFERSSRNYYIVRVPMRPKPKIAWRAPRPFVIYDCLLSALFLTLAIRLIKPSRDDISMQAIFGATLFQAGLVTAVMAIYAMFRSCCRRCLQFQDGMTLLALGVSLYLNRSLKDPWRLPAMSKAGTWRLFVGISLLEAVLIYVISRGLFLLPTKDDTIDMLQTDVNSWECSIALGLTHDYFERIKEVGEVLKRASPGHRVQVNYHNPGESRDEDSTRLSDEMVVPCVFVAVPRYADWSGGSPSPPRRRDFLHSGLLLACRIDGTGASNDNSWLCVTGVRQGYILDVSPSPLHTIMDNVFRNLRFQNDVDRKAQYLREVHRFSQRLAWLLMRAGLEDYVKVIEFEDDIMQHIPTSCRDVFAELQHHYTNEAEEDEEQARGEDVA